ncbi:unnamed protein product [Ectocarpus sp. CCAP 1310/34]|nr:unnamed protein product [Ectocarpus sp. CCAP 1310/34]
MNMRYATRAAAAVGVFAASSGSIVREAFLAPPLFHPAAVRHGSSSSSKDNKLTFASSTAAGRPTTTPPPRCRRSHGLVRCAAASPLRPTPTLSAARRRSGHRRPRDPTVTAMSAAADEGDGSVLGPLRPLSPTEDGGDVFNPNPLARNDPERARVNNLITILAGTPMAEWKPAVIDEYMESLLKRGIFRQTMDERLAKVRSGEEREALARVDSYMTGFLGHEWRKASRKKVSVILSAAAEGPMELDDCVQTLGKADLLDSDLTEYVASLITAEERKCVKSVLLKVLKTVRDRIQAELRMGARPEIRTLARALAIKDGAQRKEFLLHAFPKLEELDEFVKFVEEGIDFLGDDFGFAVRTNMPQEHFDKMKAIYAEASAMRRMYLQ